MARPRIRIAYLSQGYSPHDRRFLEAFIDHGVESYFLQFEGRVSELRPVSAKVSQISLGSLPATDQEEKRGDELEGLLQEAQIDLLLCGPLHTVGGFVARNVNFPTVQISHGYDVFLESEKSEANRLSIVEALKTADGLFVDCDSVLKKCHEIGIIPDQTKILNIPWGIGLSADENRICAERENLPEFECEEESLVLLSIRSWEEGYQIEKLLLLFKEAKLRHPEIKLILAGDGSLRGGIKKLIEEYKLIKDVYTPGWVTESELIPFFRASDLYLSTAACDGSSISLLQAMEQGSIPLLNKVGGNNDWVKHGFNGWLFDMNVTSFCEAIEASISRRKNWVDMKKNSLDLVKTQADWSVNSEVLVQYLKTLIKL